MVNRILSGKSRRRTWVWYRLCGADILGNQKELAAIVEMSGLILRKEEVFYTPKS